MHGHSAVIDDDLFGLLPRDHARKDYRLPITFIGRYKTGWTEKEKKENKVRGRKRKGGRAVLIATKAATRQAHRLCPNGVAPNGAKRYDLVDSSFPAVDSPLFCRALSVGVTLLDAASVTPSR